MFCANCGKDIPDGHDFCGNCGAPAGQALPKQAVNTVTYASGTAAKKTNSKFSIGIIAAIIIIIAALIIFANGGSNGSGVNRAPTITKDDILGEWLSFSESGTVGIAVFNEDGTLERKEARWELVGDDIIKIYGRRKTDEYAKVVFSKDKMRMLFVYYEENTGDIIDSVVIYRRREN
ncbi:MAG: zinc ribbon domain-containing protein [Oscillospiraceae bacterium]|nr:zinc ribbon domain-containing protein [Oscillospiraceae bacterium]